MVYCVLQGWSEHHTAKGYAHCGNQFTPILNVIVTPYFNSAPADNLNQTFWPGAFGVDSYIDTSDQVVIDWSYSLNTPMLLSHSEVSIGYGAKECSVCIPHSQNDVPSSEQEPASSDP